MIIVAGLSGSFLAAFQLGQFVAVSVAGSAALAAYLMMMQYEQTYNIYENTIRDLDDALSDYYVRLKAISEQEEKSEAEKAEIEAFVLHVEEILEEQRERTGVSQLQAQADAEVSLSQLVNSGGPSGADIDHLVRDIDDIDSD
jgi:hypothetical protein